MRIAPSEFDAGAKVQSGREVLEPVGPAIAVGVLADGDAVIAFRAFRRRFGDAVVHGARPLGRRGRHLYAFPKTVSDALEATEVGASKKKIVNMTPAQRRIVYADAKRHALGMLYHLQTKVHDRVGDFPESFRYMRLTDEFGTPDRLPPKPYIREGLRLEALYMLRETDIRAADRHPKWAKSMVPDGVFGFQFNIDFHPTQRKFLDGGNAGPWQFVHTANRNWHTDTDRAMLPLR